MFEITSPRGVSARVRTTSRALAAAAGMLIIAPQAAFAHAAFFTDTPRTLSVATVFTRTNMLIVIAVLATAIVIRLIAVERPHARRCLIRWVCEHLSALEPLASAVPVLARFALGGTLLIAAATGNLLAPALPLHGGSGDALIAAQLVIGVALVLGRARVLAACSTIALVAIAGLYFGSSIPFERLDIVGLALFVAFIGDARLDPRLSRWQLQAITRASWSLRVCLAIALTVTAFSEKLASPDATAAVLADHPLLDASLVLPVSQSTFISGAGAIELLLAALVLLLPVPEVTAAAICAPFVLMVSVFGGAEVLGHLPIWGGLLSLTLLGAHSQARRVVSSMTPWMSVPASSASGIERTVGGTYPWAQVEQVVQQHGFTLGVPVAAPAAVAPRSPWTDLQPLPAVPRLSA